MTVARGVTGPNGCVARHVATHFSFHLSGRIAVLVGSVSIAGVAGDLEASLAELRSAHAERAAARFDAPCC